MADINPKQMATQLATAYIQPSQSRLDSQNKVVKARSDALGKLQKALGDFESANDSLSGKRGMRAHGATFSQPEIATAQLSPGAQDGTYPLFVEQVASAQQVVFTGVGSYSTLNAGTLTIAMADGSRFNVDLAQGYPPEQPGIISSTELARAINTADGNKGRVNAMVVNNGGQSNLVLSASQSGESNAITVDLTKVGAQSLREDLSQGQELTPAQDAVVWLGGVNSGLRLQQGSNTFNNIPGISLTVNKSMSPDDAPLTLSVAPNQKDTAANVQGFVDAYNSLQKTLDDLVSPGKAENGVAAGDFASDSGIRSLRDHLNQLLRQPINGVRLMDYGVSTTRQGTLTLDQHRLQTAIDANPEGLDQLFNGGDGQKGVLASIKDYVGMWMQPGNGMLSQRRDSIQTEQRSLDQRQTQLNAQSKQAYDRYLNQYSRLDELQKQMDATSNRLNQLG